MPYHRKSLGRRLLLGFGLVIVLVAAMGFVAMDQLNRMMRVTDLIHRHPLIVSNLARDIRIAVLSMQIDLNAFAIAEEPSAAQTAWDQIGAARQRVLASLSRVDARYLGPPGDVAAARQAFLDWDRIRDAVADSVRAGDRKTAVTDVATISSDHAQHIISTVQVIIDFARAKADASHEQADTVHGTAKVVLTAMILIILIVGILVAVLVSRNVTLSVRRLSHLANQLALGQTVAKQPIAGDNEISQLTESLNAIIDANAEIAGQALAVANGNYQTAIALRSPDDALGRSLRRMTESLAQSHNLMNIQQWLSKGQTALNDRIQGELDTSAICRRMVEFMVSYLGADSGAFYWPAEEGAFDQIANHGKSMRPLPERALHGQGFIGQVAIDKQCRTRTHDHGCQLGCPLIHNNRVKGVLVFGFAAEPEQRIYQFLDDANMRLSIAIVTAESRQHLSDLLLETRQQTQTLQAHETELRRANRKLASQTRAHQKAQAALEEQQRALTTANLELAEQKRNIEEKNSALEQARRTIEQKASDLERSSRFKSEFLANMSHELRTPLNSVILLSQMMVENKEANLTTDQVESIQTILIAGKDLLRLIGDILDLSKVEAGKLLLHPEWVEPGDIAAGLLRQFKPHAEQKGLGFDVVLADGLPEHIHTDRQRLDQVLSNFISNALKFTETGRVSVQIARQTEATAVTHSGAPLNPNVGHVVFSVSDTGIGIPEAKLMTIFGAFEQVDGAMNRRYGGTGLGLSISVELARLLGGAVGVRSVVGEGSEFSLILPEQLSGNDAEALPAQFRTPMDDPAMLRPDTVEVRREQLLAIINEADAILESDRSLLIVDDDPERMKRLRDTAQQNGFQTLLAGDGETGLGMAFDQQPDAIVINLAMSGVSGWTVISRIKEATGLRHIPVYVVSGEDHRLEVLKAGAVGLLMMPASDEALVQMFERLKVIVDKTVKDLLVVEDDPQQQRWVAKVLGGDDVHISYAVTGAEAYQMVLTGRFDCMVLDLGLPDQSGAELLSQLRADPNVQHLPVVIYTGRDLTPAELALIDESAESIIIKGANSHQKLLDETSLHLHRWRSVLRPEQRRLLDRLHDTGAILSGKKILVVDDDMRNGFSLKKIMEENDMTVVVAKDGRDGLDKLNAHPDTHLVLMDIMMPEMDGFEAMAEIRRMDRYAALPIIALTAKAMREDRGKCIAAGASDYLAKPVDADRLFSMLRVWLC